MKSIQVAFFHNVMASRLPNYPYSHEITADELACLVDFLGSRYTFIDLQAFLDIQEGRRRFRFPRRPLLLCFDDGHYGTFFHGGRVLAGAKVPAVIFTLARPLVDPDFVPLNVEFYYLLRYARKRDGAYAGHPFDLSTPGGFGSLHVAFLREAFHTGDHGARNAWMSGLADCLGVPRPKGSLLPEDMRMVTAEELRRYPGQDYVQVGSHAMTHLPLALLSTPEIEEELRASREILSGLGVNYADVVSYPQGSVDRRVRDAAARLYRFGFAVFAYRSFRDPFRYGRDCLGACTPKVLTYLLSWRRRRVYLPMKGWLVTAGLWK